LKKYYPILIAGFIGGIASVIPIFKSLSCCLVIPIISVLALYFEMKSTSRNEPFKLKEGITIGFFTGISSAFLGLIFDVFITLVTHSNELVLGYPQMNEMLNTFPVDELTKKQASEMIKNVVQQIQNNGFSLTYVFAMLVNGLMSNSIFGIIGGIVGVRILNNKFFEVE
jgi:hypothetical protein